MADRSASAAFEARTAANSAAQHARDAAAAAQEAVKHAGEAANAAAQATKHAEAARKASDAAAAAVVTAKKVYALARETEADDLATRTDAGIENARTRHAVLLGVITDAAGEEAKARALDATAATLAAEAARPDVDIPVLAGKGRRLALDALKLRGPIAQDAAARALAGSDQEVVDYLRTGWREAAQRDARERVFQLGYDSPYPSVRTAAVEALKGTPEQILAFYTTGQFTAGSADMAVAVSKIYSTGGPGVKEAARLALADGSGKALVVFLAVTQYSTRLADEQVAASKSVGDAAVGPEVKAAAKIALAGSADRMHDFVAVGQYTADRKDRLAQQHTAQVQRLIAEASLIAAKANRNRWLAAEAALRANNAKAEADKAAAEAVKSAKDADGYATDADKAATAAESSAAQAKQSATVARNAAAAADRDADAAEDSAAQAEFSAQYAHDSAARAGAAAEQARASALAAGKDAADANRMAVQAWGEVKEKLEKEIAEAARKEKEEHERQQEAQKKKEDRKNQKCVRLIPHGHTYEPCDEADARHERTREHMTIAIGFAREYLFANTEKCVKDPNFGDCALALTEVVPAGKLKLLGKIDDAIQSLADAMKLKKVPPVCGIRPRSLAKADSRAVSMVAAPAVAAAQPGDDPRVFTNLLPEDKPEWFKAIAPGTTLSRSGNYAYVVLEDGQLVIGKRTAGHVSISKGGPVIAAGEFKTKGGEVVYLDNKSGHFRPYGSRTGRCRCLQQERTQCRWEISARMGEAGLLTLWKRSGPWCVVCFGRLRKRTESRILRPTWKGFSVCSKSTPVGGSISWTNSGLCLTRS
ncbi:ALF repeat-containing protein [Streptomyces sp. NPDC047097]|uniref:ALF repeat-containing protein n=1 Tax=Streptomyces sp. NPDC047097 TaxID=3155260 RepID=UPI0033E12138